MQKKVTPQMEQELFERGIIIRRAWIMPPGNWEYYVAPVGDVHSPSIAIRSTRQAAYNAAIRWLSSLPNTACTRLVGFCAVTSIIHAQSESTRRAFIHPAHKRVMQSVGRLRPKGTHAT